MKRVYFDSAATSQVLPEVALAFQTATIELVGNPSSIHTEGRRSRAAVEDTRRTIAKSLNASVAEIFFTSGGTEACNMILRNAVRDLGVTTIISSPLEHHCVLHTLDELAQTAGTKIVLLQPDALGRLDLKELAQHLAAIEGTALVSLMHGNNEIGNLIDLEQVGAICKTYNAYFHTDTVQTYCKMPIDVQKMGIHFLQGSAHKIHGPKGIGFAFIASEVNLTPYLTGGSQERNMRAGTENLPGIVAMGKAVQMGLELMEYRWQHTQNLRAHMLERLKTEFSDIQFNGDVEGETLSNILSVSFPDSDKNEMLLFNLDISGIAVSGGSACSSGVESGSHVIAALEGDLSRKTVRFSFSSFNTIEEVDFAVEKMLLLHPQVLVK